MRFFVMDRKKHASLLRWTRKTHRYTGVLLFVFFFIMSISGLLLGWKKNSGGLILPKSYQGTSADLKDWISIDSLYNNACRILHDSISTDLSFDLERIDIRKEKGMVKFVFIDHFWGIQLDGVTGELLHIERRYSDIIENIHDGSIMDYFFGTRKEQIKLVYTSIMGVSLLLFTITGFWLWRGPKVMRKLGGTESKINKR